MENTQKISVIIPIYNAERYISKCIESLIMQTYDSVEIILVDDGSKDSSLSICREFELQQDNIKVYHQENGGVSSARNLGLKMAKGYIITFVDADDWVESTFAETIIKEMKTYDILIFDGYVCQGNTKKRNQVWSSEREFCSISDKELLLRQAIAFRLGQLHVPQYHGVGITWGKAYTRQLLFENNITYNIEQRMSEDAIFNMYAINVAIAIKYIPISLYNYRDDNVSASRSFDINYIETNNIMIESFEKFIGEYEYDSNLLTEALNYRKIINIINILEKYIFSRELKKNSRKEFEQLLDTNWVLDILWSYPKPLLTRLQEFQYLLFNSQQYIALKCFYNFKCVLRKFKFF